MVVVAAVVPAVGIAVEVAVIAVEAAVIVVEVVVIVVEVVEIAVVVEGIAVVVVAGSVVVVVPSNRRDRLVEAEASKGAEADSAAVIEAVAEVVGEASHLHKSMCECNECTGRGKQKLTFSQPPYWRPRP